ncbi:MAG: PIN domain-containing protein [Verrucomicrobia bacterium]|nr:PIN domain-containing protein [Verrucomicrobiota bacterium]
MKCVVDANVFVAAIRPGERDYDSCHEFLQESLQSAVTMICPVLILAEIAGCIARAVQSRSEAEVVVFKLQKNPCLRLVSIHQSLAESAARIAARQFLKGADALYLATAQHHHAPLITLDDEILRRGSPVVAVQTPEGWLRSCKR